MNLKTENNVRIFGLDIVRSLAIFFVMLLHAGRFFPKSLFGYYEIFLFDGVGIFFVLSGFLIGGIFIKEFSKKKFNTKTIKLFWIKRWTRTLPNYYLFLFITYLVHILSRDHNVNIAPYFLFLQNLFSQSPQQFFEWSWSLSVEEWFYIILPLLTMLFVLLLKNLKTALFFTIAVVIITVTTARFFQISHLISFDAVRYSVFYRLDAIMYGVLASAIHNFYPTFWHKHKKNALAISVFLIITWLTASFSKISAPVVRVALLSITSFIVLFSLPYFNSIKTGGRFSKYISTLSVISYSLYLDNNLVQQAINKTVTNIMEAFPHIPLSALFIISYASFWILSIVLAYYIYYYFEVKATKFLRKKLINERK